MHEKQSEVNRRIVALRDSKLRLVSWLRARAQQLQKVQQRLAVHLRRPPPILPNMLTEEVPEEKLRYSHSTLERYRSLREQRYRGWLFSENQNFKWFQLVCLTLLLQ